MELTIKLLVECVGAVAQIQIAVIAFSLPALHCIKQLDARLHGY
jgi:hypothetical protein